jgi:mono/diheme cytochrome c family protein
MGLGKWFAVSVAGVALVAACAVVGCDSEKLDSGVKAAEAYPAKFSAIRDRILVPRCQYCHTNFESYARVASLSEEILEEVEEGGMPLNGTKLSEEQVEAIEAWIEEGAKND